MAEAFLGDWLRRRDLPADMVTVGSKWGYSYVGGWRIDAAAHEIKDLSVETLRRQAAESRERLGHWLRLYQIHSATLESGVLDDVSVLRELARMQAEGIVIGLTVTGPQQSEVIRRALRVNVDGANPFRVVQATWNLLEPSAAGALAEAKARGCGIIVKEALANGRLTDSATGDHLNVLKQHAASLAATVDVVAFGWALAQPWADVVLSGAVTGDQLANNLKAARLTRTLGALPAIAETAADYWTRRRALPWQ
jgi:aryl-alcohol dehydrogenase-like predicted oxidoreductase